MQPTQTYAETYADLRGNPPTKSVPRSHPALPSLPCLARGRPEAGQQQPPEAVVVVVIVVGVAAAAAVAVVVVVVV